jgi:cytochrome c peroxidase
MFRARFALVVVVWLLALLVSGIRAQQRYEWRLPPGFPIPFVPADNPMSEAKVELGRHLFYDPRLSGNGTQSCASCHQQHLAFTDGRGQAIGSTGEYHPRGSMSLVNIAYAAALTWGNPKMTRLEEQILVPMYGDRPVELGLSRGDEWLFMFRRDPVYQTLFSDAFPGAGDSFTRDNLVKALVSFQRSIISARSPYDLYAFGNRDETAISESAKRGEALFNSKELACSSCHRGVTFSYPIITIRNPDPDLEFHNNGLYNVPGLLSYPAPNTGIYEVTKNSKDVGKFKVPTLRNIAMTAPYMHDGSIAKLEDAIAHYSAGGRTISDGPYKGVGRNNPNKSGLIRGFTLTESDRRDLIAFLESLTDGQLLRDPRFADPWRGLLRGSSSGW